MTSTRPEPRVDIFDLSDHADAVSDALREGMEAGRLPRDIKLDPENVERDLPKLVLTLIEFLRQLMEAQAIRRMESGSLTEDEEERLGTTLMKARERLLEVAEKFGLEPEELTLDLGPLGRLV
ncbi:MAG: gas vesicle protein K [Pseudomonadota bacterium]